MTTKLDQGSIALRAQHRRCWNLGYAESSDFRGQETCGPHRMWCEGRLLPGGARFPMLVLGSKASKTNYRGGRQTVGVLLLSLYLGMDGKVCTADTSRCGTKTQAALDSSPAWAKLQQHQGLACSVDDSKGWALQTLVGWVSAHGFGLLLCQPLAPQLDGCVCVCVARACV